MRAPPPGRSGDGVPSFRVLVCGASGFLGSHLVEELARRPEVKLIALTRGQELQGAWCQNAAIETITADITDPEMVAGALAKSAPTHVINSASYGVRPNERAFRKSEAVNLSGTYNLLSASAAHGVIRFIQIGSYSEYGRHGGALEESLRLLPDSPYAATKAAASLLLEDQRLCGSMEAVVARVFHLWGPREHPHRLTPQVITASRTREPLKLTAGAQIKDFTFVEDAARWICDLTLRSEALEYGVYNIAGGRRCSVRDFVVDLASRVNGSDSFEFGAYEIPRREPPNGTADTSRLVSAIGPLEPTPFDAAASSTIAALQS